MTEIYHLELVPTHESIEEIEATKKRIQLLRTDGFFENLQRKAEEEGFKVDNHGIVYEGGGNG